MYLTQSRNEQDSPEPPISRDGAEIPMTAPALDALSKSDGLDHQTSGE